MKKLFAFLLALCMVLPVLAAADPATPTDLCPHEHTRTIKHDEWTSLDELIFKDNGTNESHDDYYLVEVYCDDCQQVIDTYEEKFPYGHAHAWEERDGQIVCSQCGHVNTCTHPEGTEHQVDFYYEYYEYKDEYAPVYEVIDEEHHRATALGTEFDVCWICNLHMNQVWNKQVSRIDGHNFWEDGVCECGYVNPCEHPYIFEDCDWTGTPEYTAVDNKNHTVSGTGYVYTRCAECQQTFSYNMEIQPYSKTEPHWYNEDGVCSACGHVNTCTHENAQPQEWVYSDDPDTVFTVVDNKTHIATGKGCRSTYCEDCGMNVEYTELDQVTQEDTHSYDDDGVCRYCHHKNTCTHESKITDWYFTGDAKYESVDDRYHKATGPAWVYTYCDNCGVNLEHHAEASKTGTFDHEYNTDGVCTQCGHKTTCTHGDSWYDKQRDSVEYSDNKDGKTHTVTWSGSLIHVCSLCGAPLDSTPVENQKDVEAHSFGDGTECYGCGYKKEAACTHPRTEVNRYAPSGEVLTCEPVDAYSHKFSGMITTNTYCPDCYKTIKIETAEGSYTAQHYFVNGVCADCGYKNTCAHEHTKTEQYAVNVDEVVATTATTHTVKGIVRTSVWCEDCYETIRFTDEKNATMTKAHEFDHGVCTICGYVNPCTHANKGEKVELDTRRDTYTAVDETNHRISGHGWISEVCLDCGEVFSTKAVDSCSKLEAHNMVDGVCTLCGYKEGSEVEPADEGEGTDEAAEAEGEDKLVEEVEALLTGDTAKDADVEVTVDETTGKKSVTVTPKETAENGAIVLKATPDAVKQLADQNVAEITLASADGKAGLAMDVAALAKEMEDKNGSELIVEFESEPELDEKIAEKLEEKYEVLEDAMVSVVRIALKSEDGTETELDSATFNLKVEMEYIEGMKFIYVDEEGNVSETEAVYVEATETVPGHWEIPYMGNGTYLPVLPKAE